MAAVALALCGVTPVHADEALAVKRGCVTCHRADTSAGAPTFADIAARHKGDTKAKDELGEVIKKGGKGKWTAISRGALMPPYSLRLSDAEVQRLVDWILSL